MTRLEKAGNKELFGVAKIRVKTESRNRPLEIPGPES